jgi:[calcium/calmodulin-dependent protein kinase] kinase
MDSPERFSRKPSLDESNLRGRLWEPLSRESSGSVGGQENLYTAGETSKSRQFSVASAPDSRQTLIGPPRPRSAQPDIRLEDRRGLSYKLQILPYRPCPSTTSRNSSNSNSSSSLPSLADQTGVESGSDCPNPCLLISPKYNLSSPRAVEISHVPPLSPLTEDLSSSRAENDSNDLPVYPDQSYAVLQSQVHPVPYQLPLIRSRSSCPSHYYLPSTPSLPSWQPREYISRSQGPRTAGNTPISSPGLFSSLGSRSPRPVGSNEDFRLGGSYLHPTHLQEPKE